MRTNHLTLRNWRTFKNLDTAVGERLVVIGANASGKSNLLAAQDAASLARALREVDG